MFEPENNDHRSREFRPGQQCGGCLPPLSPHDIDKTGIPGIEVPDFNDFNAARNEDGETGELE